MRQERREGAVQVWGSKSGVTARVMGRLRAIVATRHGSIAVHVRMGEAQKSWPAPVMKQRTSEEVINREVKLTRKRYMSSDLLGRRNRGIVVRHLF
jgi:hypothetical protein